MERKREEGEEEEKRMGTEGGRGWGEREDDEGKGTRYVREKKRCKIEGREKARKRGGNREGENCSSEEKREPPRALEDGGPRGNIGDRVGGELVKLPCYLRKQGVAGNGGNEDKLGKKWSRNEEK